MVVWNGREWMDEKLLDKFKKNNSLILECQLAIENYEDFSGETVESFHELNDLWKKQKVVSLQEADLKLYELSEEFLKKYYRLLEEIGNEKFIFYDDGTVEYRD